MKLTKNWQWIALQLVSYFATCAAAWPLPLWRFFFVVFGIQVLVGLIARHSFWFTETRIWPIREKTVGMMKLNDFIEQQNIELAHSLAERSRTTGSGLN